MKRNSVALHMVLLKLGREYLDVYIENEKFAKEVCSNTSRDVLGCFYIGTL